MATTGDLPPETLSLVLRKLVEPQNKWNPNSPLTYEHLCNARLVCRQWHALATPHLFRTVTLDAGPKKGDWSWEDNVWNRMIGSKTVQTVARNVVICSHHSGPTPKGNGEDTVLEYHNDDNEDDPLAVAINGIAKLPNLQSLQITFGDTCMGDRVYDWGEEWGVEADEDYESITHRLQTLNTVFRAIQKRCAALGLGDDSSTRPSTIRSLALKNLQNLPIRDFAASDLYKDIVKDLTELHLLITHEYHEHGPDRDLEYPERQTYEPYLQNELLPPLAQQLTSLTLVFKECWGVMPAYFNGAGLAFPALKTLTLGEFVIGHHDQFDWVLAQKSLETLRLGRCFIVSHLNITNDHWNAWSVRTHDWQELPDGAFDSYRAHAHAFGFSGTWGTVYDAIRDGLPNLREFCFEINDRDCFDGRENMGARLSKLRYIVFDSGLCPSPWIEAHKWDGQLEFGNNDPTPYPPDPTRDNRPIKTLSRAQETEVGDSRAFEQLLRVVQKRQR